MQASVIHQASFSSTRIRMCVVHTCGGHQPDLNATASAFVVTQLHPVWGGGLAGCDTEQSAPVSSALQDQDGVSAWPVWNQKVPEVIAPGRRSSAPKRGILAFTPRETEPRPAAGPCQVFPLLAMNSSNAMPFSLRQSTPSQACFFEAPVCHVPVLKMFFPGTFLGPGHLDT